MEYPWRPRPPTSNFCPVCSNSHFPFCPPAHPQFFRPPPPPPDQHFHSPLPPPPTPTPPAQPPYDPFVDHNAATAINSYPPPPPPGHIPPRPWNGNPNFSRDYYGNSVPGFDYDNNVQVGVKRMRFNNVNDSYMSSLAEDERRLKLIRDHGAMSHGLDRKSDAGYMIPNHSLEPSSFPDKKGEFGNHYQGIEGGYRQEINLHMKQNYGERQVMYQHTLNNKNVELGRPLYNISEGNLVQSHGYGEFIHGAKRPGNHEILASDPVTHQEPRSFLTESREFNNQLLQSHTTQQPLVEPKSSYYGFPHHDSQGFNLQPPLPTSPPPPLPAEPPRYSFSESVVSSSASGPPSLFPVAVDSSSSFQSPYTMVSEAIRPVPTHFTSKANPNSNGYYREVYYLFTSCACLIGFLK